MTLSNLITQFEKNDAHAHADLRDTALRMRHAGDGLWEEMRVRAQQEVEASAQSVRKVLGKQAQEMRYMVSVLKGCTGLEHTFVSNTMHLQMDELLHDTAGMVSLYFWAHDHLLT